MKKEMKHYESPKMEVIEMDPTVILAGSGEDEGNEGNEGNLPNIGDGGNVF